MSGDVLETVDAFFGQPLNWDILWTCAATELRGVPDEYRRAVRLALGYMLPLSHESGRRREGYGPFVPILEMDGAASAPPLSDVPGDIVAVWEELAERCQSSSARARFNDLLWSMRHGSKRGLRARDAIDAYLALAGSDWPSASEEGKTEDLHMGWFSLKRADCLHRAHQIAKESNNKKAAAEIVEIILESAANALSNGAMSGTILSLLRTLVEVIPDDRRCEARRIVADARARYQVHIHLFSQLTELEVSLADSDAEKRALRLELTDARMAHARQADGIKRLVELQEALHYARMHGLSERLDDLRAELDKIDPDSYDMRAISAGIDLTDVEIEDLVESHISAEGFMPSLSRFGYAQGCPPSGTIEENHDFVQESAQETPLLSIIPTIVVDMDGRPIVHGDSEQDRFRLAITRQESIRISLWANFAVEILRRIRERFGVPSEEDLARFFETELIPGRIARRIARAHHLYFSDRHEESAYLLAPQIEAVIRQLCLSVGIPVSREAFAKDTGGVATLGPLLRDLDEQKVVDPSWARYLINALVEPTGINLRNRICHGVIDEISQQDAAILLHIINYLRLIRVRPREEAAHGEDSADE